MNFVKRFACVFPLAGLVAFGLYSLSGPVLAGERDNGVAAAAPVTLGNATRGVIFGTAAINADGAVASCFNCNKAATVHLFPPGTYQVAFNFGNVTANAGFSRWVQVDTLSTGATVGVSCATADRAGVPSAIWVQCFNGSGALVDTSFFLFLAR